jgi:hypothetical protein
MSATTKIYQKPRLHIADQTSVLLQGDFGDEDDSPFREPIEPNPEKRSQRQKEKESTKPQTPEKKPGT